MTRHDTPFELLHTYSLRIMKYGWRHVVSRIPKDYEHPYG